MIKLLDIDDLRKGDIHKIWRNVTDSSDREFEANIAWSFEGNGIRTRTTFVQAFQKLRVNYVELPNFLKTGESVQDLAGYMDSFYSMYVIRETNHQRLKEFAAATTKPVINAMSGEAHPCEVLTDAYYLFREFDSLQDVRILLWGPVTNVFKSWHSLSNVLGLNITQFCPLENHPSGVGSGVSYLEELTGEFDVVVTDAWPAGFSDNKYCLTEQKLLEMGKPLVLPTPPVTMGNELQNSLANTTNFVGYQQKALLLPVQTAIISYLLEQEPAVSTN